MKLLNRLKISTRVYILAATGILLLLLSGSFGLRSLSETNDGLQDLFENGMAHSVRVAKVIGLLNEVHTEMLLALQHAPDGHFAAMHDHPVQAHLDEAEAGMQEITRLWSAIASSDLVGEEKAIVEQFQKGLDTLHGPAWTAFRSAIAASDFAQANRLVLGEVKSVLRGADGLADKMLQLQVAEAQDNYNLSEKRYAASVTTLMVLLGVAFVVSGFVAWAIKRAIGNAVRVLDHAATEIAEGNLGEAVTYPGDDELAHVAGAVDRIRRDFLATVSSVRDAVGRIAAAAQQTSVVSGQTREEVNTQRLETEQVATAMQEMNATVHDVARNAAETANAARAADTSAARGRDVVNHAISTINRLAGDVENASEVIGRLQQESQQIGGVLDVIRSIAEQTNLLALNAAIEAARAGEQGRGFAVVADEVRTLASRTQASTSEIQDMISRLQGGAGKAAEVMTAGSVQARTSVEQAAEAGSALQAITDAVDRITDMSTQIASAVEQQSAVTEEINRNIQNITDIAEQTHHGANQNAEAAVELSTLASNLQQDVSRFRV